MIPLIYCASGNKRFMQIAVNAGFLYGGQLPGTIYPDIAPLYFADQNWKKPQKEKYLAAIAEYKPFQATVLDLEKPEQIAEVFKWAEAVAHYVQRIIIIPKVFGIIPQIPEKIAGKDIVLGYSVPTKYAGTELPIWEFEDRPIHLLGGSPQKQIAMLNYLNAVSADGNYIQMKATKFCTFYNERGGFTQLKDAGLGEEEDAPYVAFEMSCKNFMRDWKKATKGYEK